MIPLFLNGTLVFKKQQVQYFTLKLEEFSPDGYSLNNVNPLISIHP